MRKFLILCAFFMPFFVLAANTPQISDFANSSRIYKRQFSLTANTQYKFRTFSSGDSVLYLLNSNYVQVAMNDDCGSDCLSTQDSNDSTLTYTPTTTGTYHLVMRNYSSGQVGVTANLKQYINGTLGSSVSNAPLGGRKQSVPSWDAYYQTFPTLSYRKLYFYYFNTDKNASGGASAASNVLYLVSNNGIVAYDHDSGAGLTSRITKSSGSCSSGCYIFGGAFNAASEGNARLIVDPYTNFSDLDSDGLSDALEVLLGTVSAPSGTIFGRDSDGDGLNDYIETVGYDSLALPWEGSSPTQRDIFLEVDYFKRTIGGNYVNFFKDHETYIKTKLSESFLTYGNIRLHIDVDDYLGVMEDNGSYIFAHLLNEANNYEYPGGYYLEDNMSTDFTQARNGIYHWIVAANRHTSPDTDSSGVSLLPGNRLIVSLGYVEHTPNNGVIYPATQEEYTGTTMHELGHALGLRHNKNENKSSSNNSIIHRSVMNYNYQKIGVPLNISTDKEWRYATDNSSNRSGLNWNYTNVIPEYLVNTGANGCVQDPYYDNFCSLSSECYGGTYCYLGYCRCSSNSDCYEGLVCESGLCLSPKKTCRDAGNTAQPTCDCTFNEWAILDLTSGGNMVRSAFTSAGIISENASPDDPFFGLEGYVVALNLEDLMTSGEKYTEIKKFQNSAEKEPTADDKFYTKENRKIYNDAYKEYFRKMGYEENKDFFVNDDKVFLISDEKE
ncbi:pre-peptidase C-terminal domain-containing protein [bacterium]|nr:pre-peptidase C-terminal domain-containing protein [bacterium]